MEERIKAVDVGIQGFRNLTGLKGREFWRRKIQARGASCWNKGNYRFLQSLNSLVPQSLQYPDYFLYSYLI